MFNRFLGVFFCGLVIKIMDDFLDQEIDFAGSNFNLITILNKGTLPYSLVLLIFALSLNFNESVTYFTSSYMLGMAHDFKEKLPSKLYAWQEGLLLFLLGIVLTSFYESISALVLILLAQIIDDLMDYKKDKYLNRYNFVYIFGFFNLFIISSILLIISLKYFPVKLLFFLLSLTSVYFLLWFIKLRMKSVQ